MHESTRDDWNPIGKYAFLFLKLTLECQEPSLVDILENDRLIMFQWAMRSLCSVINPLSGHHLALCHHYTMIYGELALA